MLSQLLYIMDPREVTVMGFHSFLPSNTFKTYQNHSSPVVKFPSCIAAA